MNINKQIKKTLSSLNIPIFYNTRGNCKEYPLIVFHTLENIVECYDGVKDIDIEYSIYINIYSNLQDSLRLSKEIKRLMLNNGFRYRPNFSGSDIYDEELQINLKNLVFSKIIEENYNEEE